MNRRVLWSFTTALVVLAAACLAADGSSEGDGSPVASGGASASSAESPAVPEDPELAARQQASRSIDTQPIAVQRSYYERWVAALEGSLEGQRASLASLRQHRDSAAATQRVVIDQRIAAGEQRIASLEDELAGYRERLTALAP